MTIPLRQSTASQEIPLGHFLDSTDGNTEETGLTVANTDIKLWKHGATTLANKNSGGATHISNGIYYCVLDATDSDTLGAMDIYVHVSGALAIKVECRVLPAHIYDTLVIGTDKLEVDLIQMNGVAQSALDLKDFADAGYDPATNKVQGVVLCDTTTTNTDMVGTANAALASALTTHDGKLDTVDANVDAILLDTGTTLDGKINTIDGIVDSILLDTGTDGVLLAATAASAQLVDDIWDELLTGATHNIATSAGRRVREVGAFAIHTGTAQAGTTTSITLAAAANGGDGVYNRNLIVVVDGTGKGQTRTIVDYDDTTKVVVIDRDWRIAPDTTSEYQIVPDDTPLTVDHGKAQGATSTTITLRAYASSVDDTYLCNQVAIIAGTGRGQVRLIGSYNGTTKVATICGDNWVTTPDTTSIYAMMPYGTTCASCIGTHALSQINTECDTALTDYDPPTRTEATSDKDAIITEVDANEAKIDIIDTNVDSVLADTGTDGVVVASGSKTGYALSAAGIDSILDEVVEGTLTHRQVLRILLAALAGKSSGGGTATLAFRDDADSKSRITATVDVNGNRTAISKDGT